VINFIILLGLMSANPCLNSNDTKIIARSTTSGTLHSYLKNNHLQPLGIYEKISLKNTPLLKDLTAQMPPIVAVKYDKKISIRAMGLVINGAYYAKGCIAKSKLIKRKISFKDLLLSFRRAITAKTPAVRKGYLAYALFNLGIWMADKDSIDGPKTRLNLFLKAVYAKKPSILRGTIYLEMKNGIRTAIKSKTKIVLPKEIVRIIVLSYAGQYSLVLPWPAVSNNKNYPKIILNKKSNK
jgi:hypothetical protein